MMQSTHLNEHDANQGAQSSGEFLGMTGNSGWFLLGSGGATILMVIVLWGIFGVSLLLCLLVGIVLCVGSVAYVFMLKNSRPEHYDTDFFESALVEAGVMQFSFGPRCRRPVNPFTDAPGTDTEVPAVSDAVARRRPRPAVASGWSRVSDAGSASAAEPARDDAKAKPNAARSAGNSEAVNTPPAYEGLEEQLAAVEEMLEDALAERRED